MTAPVAMARVVDSRTKQGLPYIRVSQHAFGSSSGPGQLTDLEGRVPLQPMSSDRMLLTLKDGLTGRILRGRVLRPDTIDASEAQLVHEVEVGPTLIVKLVGAPPATSRWRVRLLETSMPHKGRAWSWIEPVHVEPGGVLAARYRHYELNGSSDRTLLVQVADQGEIYTGEAAVRGLEGVHSLEVAVVARRIGLSGRVVDEHGRSVPAEVFLFPRARRDSSEPALRTTTVEGGAWQLVTDRLGPMRVVVFSDWRPTEQRDVELALGENPPLEIVLPRASTAHVSGALVGPPESEDPTGILCLESAGTTDSATYRSWMHAKVSTAGRSLFGFEGVSAGRHRVHLISFDGRKYLPASAEVDAPGYVELATQQITNLPSSATYDLRLVDAVTHNTISADEVELRVRLAPLWSSTVVHGDPLQALARAGEDAPVTLLVGKRGYFPACLDLRAALKTARREPPVVEIELRLEPGHGAALIVLDAQNAYRTHPWTAVPDDWRHSGLRWSWRRLDAFLPMAGLAGARIVSDGRTLGTSDATGLAMCRSERAIERFEVVLDGWTMLDVEGFRGHLEDPFGLGFVFMVRD